MGEQKIHHPHHFSTFRSPGGPIRIYERQTSRRPAMYVSSPPWEVILIEKMDFVVAPILPGARFGCLTTHEGKAGFVSYASLLLFETCEWSVAKIHGEYSAGRLTVLLIVTLVRAASTIPNKIWKHQHSSLIEHRQARRSSLLYIIYRDGKCSLSVLELAADAPKVSCTTSTSAVRKAPENFRSHSLRYLLSCFSSQYHLHDSTSGKFHTPNRVYGADS